MDSLVTAFKASDMIRRNPLPEDSACVFVSFSLYVYIFFLIFFLIFRFVGGGGCVYVL